MAILKDLTQQKPEASTLYVEQWIAILNEADTLREFIARNETKLKRKGE